MANIGTLADSAYNIFKRLTGGGQSSGSRTQFPQTTTSASQAYELYGKPAQNNYSKLSLPQSPSVSPLPTDYAQQAALAASQAQSDARLEALQREIERLSNPQPTAPPSVAPLPELPAFSVEDTFKKAREIAASNVSPYYEKQLNQFRERQNLRRNRAKEDFGRVQSDIDREIKTVQEGNKIAQARTEEDVQKNIEDVVRQEAEAQLGSSTSFNRAYDALRGGQAQSGTLRSGIGKQQPGQAVGDKKLAESRITAGADRQTKAQQLFKTRTLQDIARSNELALQEGEVRKKSGQINLDRLIQDTLDETIAREQETELQKQQTIESQVGPAAQTLFNKFTSELRNPEAAAYANSIYGGSF